jgi:hypothetical protein
MNRENRTENSVEPAITPRETSVLDALRKIRFGSVEVIIHDGEVVQIERKEKVRFSS